MFLVWISSSGDDIPSLFGLGIIHTCVEIFLMRLLKFSINGLALHMCIFIEQCSWHNKIWHIPIHVVSEEITWTISGHYLHCIVLYCVMLHCIALHCIPLHCVALRCVALHIALHCILHCIALYLLYCIVLYCIVRCIVVHYSVHVFTLWLILDAYCAF